MKILHIILTALLLSSCASSSSKEETPISQRIQFSGARSDLFLELRKFPQTLIEQPFYGEGTQITQFPLTYAVDCNVTKTNCKQAIVKTQLEFTAQVTAESRIKVSGILHSEMGRSLSWASAPSPAYSQTVSMSIPSGVEVIREFMDDQRFEKVLRMDEKLELKGLAGVQVALSFQ